MEKNSRSILVAYDPRHTRNNEVALPSKFFGALHLGKPVIFCEGTLLSKLVRDFGIKISINPENPEEVRRRIIEFLTDEKSIRKAAMNSAKFSKYFAPFKISSIYWAIR